MFKTLFKFIARLQEKRRKKIAFLREKRRLERIIEKYKDKWMKSPEFERIWYQAFVDFCAHTDDPRIIHNGSTLANVEEWERQKNRRRYFWRWKPQPQPLQT